MTAIISDPPYGNDNMKGDLNAYLQEHRNDELPSIRNDDQNSMREVIDAVLVAGKRFLAEPCAVALCCSGGGGPNGPQFAWLANRLDEHGLQFFHQVIWDKRNPGIGWRYRRQFEQIMIGHRRGGRIAWADPSLAHSNIISYMPRKNRIHPNEKPIDLLGKLLDLHTKPGELVLDPFMGSGTTGVAAARWGRKFVGVEIEEHYFEMSCKRIEEAYKQPQLFAEKPAKEEQIGLEMEYVETGRRNLNHRRRRESASHR